MTDTNQDNTYSVLLAFDGPLPSSVQVAPFLRLKINPHLPRPMQCHKCWMFGHTQARCRNQGLYVNTVRCADMKVNCAVANNEARRRCVTCKGPHEASSRLCGRYQDNLNILMLSFSKTPPLPFKEAQKLYVEEKKQNQTVSRMAGTQPAARVSYAAVAARSADIVDQTSRETTDAPLSTRQKASFNYNPNGVILDKSELESIVFSHMVTLRLLDSFISNDYPTPDRDPILDVLQRSFTKVNDVLIRHQMRLQETNAHIVNGLPGNTLNLGFIMEV